MAGMVASPTPTVAISSDSTRVMSSIRPRTLEMAAAALHPAVPPPAMTTRRMGLGSCSGWECCCMVGLQLSFHFIEQRGAQGAGAIVVERRQHALRVLRYVPGLFAVAFKNIVAEQVLPCLALRR